MRHESIETTLDYYVQEDAEELAARLHRAFEGDLLGDPDQNPDNADHGRARHASRKS